MERGAPRLWGRKWGWDTFDVPPVVLSRAAHIERDSADREVAREESAHDATFPRAWTILSRRGAAPP
jgi:hypothetical protein